MGGQLVFDWDRLENFLTTRDRPVGNKSQIQYHMPKSSITCANTVAPSPFMHRQMAKCLLRLNHDCHAIICRASLWSATAIDTKEDT